MTNPFIATRTSLHMVCEHVLSAARYQAVGRIGLVVVPGGIATPPFGDDATTISVIDGQLVVERADTEQRTTLTTLRAAGEFVGITPGASRDVYVPSTPCDLDAALTFDATSLRDIVAWYTLTSDALQRFSTDIADDEPSAPTLWPEHFDLAIRAADINYGGLAGDGGIPDPYLYVGPPTEHLASSPDVFWNQPFGSSATQSDIGSVNDAVAYFHRGRTAARALDELGG